MDREIRILHTADTHLGYRQYHSEARRNDFFAAFELVINDAVEMQVDAVVHAGDLFDSRNPTLEDLLETMNILSRLKAADIPFFGIVGNHESKQNTQWLDLFEEMGLAERLGKKPLMVGNVAIYGIDSVPKSKIPIFDYSEFEAPSSTLCTPSTSSTSSTSSTLSVPSSSDENYWKLLVMHQIMSPFPYAEWDCDEVLENLPFKIDAVLLGDYHEHSITKNKTGETWITYPGSTERNSTSEKEARSYNIITLSEKGLEISKRTILTRNFLFIPVELNEEDKPYEQIFSKIDEHLEEIPDSVVSLQISGDPGAVLSQSELEEYLLNKGSLVSNFVDRRAKESLSEEILKVTFSDPDHAVANEIKNMSLNDGGLIIDEIVRSPNISRSRVDEETENLLSKLIETKSKDFKNPYFKIEIPASPSSSTSSSSSSATEGYLELEYVKSGDKVKSAEKTTGKFEITELSEVLKTSDGIENKERKSIETGAEASKGIEISDTNLNNSGLVSGLLSELKSGSNSKQPSNLESMERSVSKPAELSDRLVAPKESEPHQETSRTLNKIPRIKIDIWKDQDNNSENKFKNKLENKPELELSENESEKDIRKLSEMGTTNKTEREIQDKVGELSEEKTVRTTDLSEKVSRIGHKNGKGKPAIPRQYNLGDYL